jgi:hypothetical protein
MFTEKMAKDILGIDINCVMRQKHRSNFEVSILSGEMQRRRLKPIAAVYVDAIF